MEVEAFLNFIPENWLTEYDNGTKQNAHPTVWENDDKLDGSKNPPISFETVHVLQWDFLWAS